jgi:two-component system, chemotaxis family, CheB/CheR fusion protein
MEANRMLTQSMDPARKTGFPVVGIGASAGGLEACKNLLDAVPHETGMAYILVQHLDPTHASLLVELLSRHTEMVVCEAQDGMWVEPDHLYIIPPGAYLACGDGMLLLSQPTEPHGARLPFDFLLKSMALAYGKNACCIVLSGSGADGSLGIEDIKAHGGFVLAQDPAEAGNDGMPNAAIETGQTDATMCVRAMPATLAEHFSAIEAADTANNAPADEDTQAIMSEIIAFLRLNSAHDFSHYKRGTLERRIGRRMALASIGPRDMTRYLDFLKSDTTETSLLANDLLINVTSFFRNPDVFTFLADKTIPEMVRQAKPGQSLRIWIAGCSTGEEAYSLAILLMQEADKSKSHLKLQIFASDVDADAVAIAREGFYTKSVEDSIPKEALERFFIAQDTGYRVKTELREAVVFTVHDVLTDPPFSRLNLISCRNLLIYLSPEAQKKVISIFHFGLRENGLLLLGSSETAGNIEHRFEVASKPNRLYRRIGPARWGDINFAFKSGETERTVLRPGHMPQSSGQQALAELCQRLIMENYAPAAVLINARNECLYSVGPAEQFLQVTPGYLKLDIFSMTPSALHPKLRYAIQQATLEKRPVRVRGLAIQQAENPVVFDIDVQPVANVAEALLLVSFIPAPQAASATPHEPLGNDDDKIARLEHELESAIKRIETLNEEQRSFNEEALSFNEEYQSANEELLTSKEELQSLNEELTALNTQLQESLERQRMTSDDLQNVLFSTDVATLFLDMEMKIRFFTPATKSLFNVIASDIGRPLADLYALVIDEMLAPDVRQVLIDRQPIERQIEARNGTWFVRRVLPYLTQENRVEGVVITFSDITERKHILDGMDKIKRQAQSANAAKSRFLAAASHDLRQPLQTLTLLQGLLSRQITEPKASGLIARFGETLSSMAGMLNTLLDINQIEAGTVKVDIVRFPIHDLLLRMRDEFSDSATAKGLSLHVVASSAIVKSDPRLLEQMVRNLLSNALKYTISGKVLLGCRSSNGELAIEVGDTGIGIADGNLDAIFDEFHQVDNVARERSRGLGLGLAIVKRLGTLLQHEVQVRSTVGKGSVFSIVLERSALETGLAEKGETKIAIAPKTDRLDARTILVVEDNHEVRELLELLLTEEGFSPVMADDGNAALQHILVDKVVPGLILADFNLPNGMNGLELASTLCKHLNQKIPVVILTGDISTGTLRDIAAFGFTQMNKPIKVPEMMTTIRRLLPPATGAVRVPVDDPMPAPTTYGTTSGPVIYIVDDDDQVRDTLKLVLEDDGRHVEAFESCESFLSVFDSERDACLLVDAILPGMDGMELLQRLSKDGHRLASIMITGNSDVPMAVRAMKAGASDFIEKPVRRDELIASINRAMAQAKNKHSRRDWQNEAARQISGLTGRQRQIMDLVLAGHPSKNIAADLGISQRTVENHRASIMQKTGAKSLPALARLAMAAKADDASAKNA